MNAENFAYWLQGFFEITGDVKSLTPEQIKMIKNHLDLVFEKRTQTVIIQGITAAKDPLQELKDYLKTQPQQPIHLPFIAPYDPTVPYHPGITITC